MLRLFCTEPPPNCPAGIPNAEIEKPITVDGLRMQQGISYKVLAERTGLEPATPGVTGRYSNQLNYHSAVSLYILWLLDLGSNQGPTD